MFLLFLSSLPHYQSVRHLLALISKFGICSGLVINFDKTEMFILGNSVMAPAQDQSIMNINVKRAVKILGVYFTMTAV